MNPTPATNEQEQQVRAEGTDSARRRRPTLAVVALLLALLAGGLAGWSLLATQRSGNASREAVASLQAAVATFEQTARDTQQAATHRESALSTSMQDIERRIADAENLLNFRATDWLLAEAEYYLSLANEQLILSRDTGTAITALEIADARLQRANLGEALRVREEIATAIAVLRAAQRPDLAGHALKLTALIARADQLPLARAEAVAPAAVTAPEVAPTDVLAMLWSRLTSLIVVRRSNQALPALLTPEQTLLLRLNLQLQLTSARAAMLHQDQNNYTASLHAARDWLEKYFDKTEPEVAAATTQLDALAQVGIAWQTPDIAAPLLSLRALRAESGARNQRPQKVPTTAPPRTAPTGATP